MSAKISESNFVGRKDNMIDSPHLPLILWADKSA